MVPRANLPPVVDTVISRPWPNSRRDDQGEMEPANHARGGPLGPPLLFELSSGANFLALKDHVGNCEDDDHPGNQPRDLRPDQDEALPGGQRSTEQHAASVEYKAARRTRFWMQQRDRDLVIELTRRNPIQRLGGL